MLYKYCSGEDDESIVALMSTIVSTNTLLASNPSSFNDPFEFKARIYFDEEQEECSRVRFLADQPDETAEQFQDWWGQTTKPFDLHRDRVMRRRLLQRLGVACLSKTSDHILMWSHYARSHTGFCIGYDYDRVKEHANVQAHGSVQYTRTSPTHYYSRESMRDLVKQCLFYKSEEWEYEQEVRVIYRESGVISLATGAVRELHVGCLATDHVKEQALSIADVAGIECWQMIEDPSDYSLTRRPVTRHNIRQPSSFR
jgi:hypothetical protein